MRVIDLSYLDEIRDVVDSNDDKLVLSSYQHYKEREEYLIGKELLFLKMLTKEVKERGLLENKGE